MARLTEFTWEKIRLTVSCEKPSKEDPFGTMSRKSVWFFSMKGFWEEHMGSQKNKGISFRPSPSFSKEKTSENSPPLSHRRTPIREAIGHEVAGGEVDGHDNLPTDTSDDGVRLHVPFQKMLPAEVQEVIMGAAGPDAGRDVILMPCPAFSEPDRTVNA